MMSSLVSPVEQYIFCQGNKNMCVCVSSTCLQVLKSCPALERLSVHVSPLWLRSSLVAGACGLYGAPSLAPRAVSGTWWHQRQPAAGPMASFLLPWAWEANTANCKWAPTLTLFCTHPVEAPHKSGLGQVNGNGHLWTSKPNCANRKTLIHLKLPRRKSFKEMQRKHLIWLIWCGFNWKLGHGLNYLRVS